MVPGRAGEGGWARGQPAKCLPAHPQSLPPRRPCIRGGGPKAGGRPHRQVGGGSEAHRAPGLKAACHRARDGRLLQPDPCQGGQGLAQGGAGQTLLACQACLVLSLARLRPWTLACSHHPLNVAAE